MGGDRGVWGVLGRSPSKGVPRCEHREQWGFP